MWITVVYGFIRFVLIIIIACECNLEGSIYCIILEAYILHKAVGDKNGIRIEIMHTYMYCHQYGGCCCCCCVVIILAIMLFITVHIRNGIHSFHWNPIALDMLISIRITWCRIRNSINEYANAYNTYTRLS